MSQIVHILPGDPEESNDLAIAKAIAVELEAHYPGHYWMIGFRDHNLCLTHVGITNAVTVATGKEGFCSLLPRDRLGTVQEACKTAVRFAGALLEAFRLPLGAAVPELFPTIPNDLYHTIMRGQQIRGMGQA
jgi:hypothetical protein